ncbi:MAG: hypothetical protein ACT4PW_00760 [Acidimicrobiia bacterium]
MNLATGLHIVGYPISIALAARFVPIVRRRQLTQFLAHEAAVGAVVAGWMLRDRFSGVAVNGTWLVGAAVWYARGRPATAAELTGWWRRRAPDGS